MMAAGLVCSRSCLGMIASLGLVGFCGGLAHAQEGDRGLVDRWKAEAAEYAITPRTPPHPPLTLRAEPALTWTNPLRETDGGLVFLWLDNGRPAVAACFYRARWEGKLTEAHEFHSLAPTALDVTLKGQPIWEPEAAGVTFRAIPDAPRPAPDAPGRLRQMRALAREFRVQVDPGAKGTDLRPLSQPIYRYESTPADGALFAFVLTTDPEALLLIEAREEKGQPAWHYAFARMTDHALEARLRDRTVWEVPKDQGGDRFHGPYCVRWDVGPRE